MKKATIICIALTVIAAAVGITMFVNSGMLSDLNPTQHVEDKTVSPTRGSIEDTVTASGMVKNNAEYTVTSPVSAKVLDCYIEEGDTVSEGSLLYKLDDSAIQRQITQTKVALETARTTYNQSQSAYNDLSIKANATGIATKLYVNNGDMIQPGAKIMDIVDNSTMLLKLPFNAGDAAAVTVGTPATVMLSNSGQQCSGTISMIHSGTNTYGNNRVGFLAEISVKNPGGINKGDKATAIAGGVASLAEGAFDNLTEKTTTATTSGQIIELNKIEGAAVYDGETVVKLKNDTLKNAMENTSLQIKSTETTISNLSQQLNDYLIKAPTSGTVKKVVVKKGEQGQGQLAVIADNSGLYVDAEVDEASIGKVKPDLNVHVMITNSDKEYPGTVVSIDSNGVAKNGDTYYSVKIRIENNEDFMAGMNVDLYIVSNTINNALLLPRNAVSANAVKVVTPTGVVTKQVKTGVKNNDYIEILDGITESDKVISQEKSLYTNSI